MVRIQDSSGSFSAPRPKRLFYPKEPCLDTFPIQNVQIAWQNLIAKREMVPDTVGTISVYTLKPKVLSLLDAGKYSINCLILDLIWTIWARISEALAFTASHFICDGYDYLMILQALKQRLGWPTKRQLVRRPKRVIPIVDPMLIDRIQSYLNVGHFRQYERIFTMARQTVNRHIYDLVERVGGAPINISSKIFSPQLRDSPATAWTAAADHEPAPRAQIDQKHRNLHQCAHR